MLQLTSPFILSDVQKSSALDYYPVRQIIRMLIMHSIPLRAVNILGAIYDKIFIPVKGRPFHGSGASVRPRVMTYTASCPTCGSWLLSFRLSLARARPPRRRSHVP